MINSILRSTFLGVFVCLAGIHPASAGIIPDPNMTPTPTIPPIIAQPTPTPTTPPINPPPPATPTVPPVPNPNALAKADPQLARAVVYYGQNGTLPLLNDRGRFQKVALQPDEIVTILLTLSPLDYGKPAAIELLDGGAMSTSVTVPKPKGIIPTPTPNPSPTINAVPLSSNPGATPTVPPVNPSTLIDTGALMTVSQAGEVIFGFKPGADAGRHRISIIVGGNQYYLQFWRQDSSAPNNNPRMLRAY